MSFVSNLEVQVRKEVEQVLRKHVRRLSGVTHELSNVFLSLDMLTLTTTVLLVERENEIEQSLEDERYSDNGLLKSLSELGLNQEREIRRTLQIMEQKKYFDILEDKTYHPLEVATKLTTHINSIFPQMPGLNLIVYFNQIIDEVLSNRKTVELAVAQIDKTLQTQGASKFKVKGKTKSKTKGKDTKPKPSLASMLKKSKRLSSLNRLKKKKAAQPKPNVVQPQEQNQPIQPTESVEEKASRIVSDDLGNLVANDFDKAYAINPDDIGAGVTDPQALADMFVGSDEQTTDDSSNTEDIFEPDTDISVDMDDDQDSQLIDSNAQSYADQLFQSLQPEKKSDDVSTEKSDLSTDDKHDESDEEDEIEEEYEEVEEDEEDEIEDEDEEYDEDEDEDEDDEDEDEDEDEEEDSDDEDDDEIKRQIEEMNESLKYKQGIRQKSHEALNCPLCHEETIVELETSSHKSYYSCNNEDCKFISWDKPLDQKCPKCENLFLIEVDIDGKQHYKCPNASCDYQINQDDVTDETFLTPLNTNKSESSGPDKTKKRKKRVRKVRVRRK